jgi:Tfp pilus assembly protein PilO
MNRLQGVSFGLLKSKVVLIVTGIVIVLLLVWWFAWMTPEANKLSTVQQQIAQDNTTVTSLSMELIQLKAEAKLVRHELPYLKMVTAAIPPTEDPPGIVDSLNTLANKTGCDLLSVTPANFPSPGGTAGLSVISVTFSVTGSHKNIFAFLKNFYSMTRLMTIGNVSLAPGGTTPNILDVSDNQPYSMSVSATAYTTAA